MIQESIKQHGIDKLKEGIGVNEYGSDLHNELYNMDYFVIGYYQAEQWLKENNLSVFEAIEYVNEYEKDHFGEIQSYNNAEKLVNIYAYIKGEEFLMESPTLSDKSNNILDEDDIKTIINELENV